MPKLNWEIILSNIAEAREQLEALEKRANNEKAPTEIELQIMLEHAYHHLNFAWNLRRVSTERYSRLTDKEFNKWSKLPKEIEAWKIDLKKNKKAKTRK
ncbi:MAG: hypothetical protein H7Y30_05940 [Pyrinomonadaceae bacterium]|nr:hypothetical protein [Pyrinomonadaceae bacterium]